MSIDKPSTATEYTRYPDRLQILMTKTRQTRSSENWINVGKLIGVVYFLLFVFWILAILLQAGDFEETNFFFVFLGIGFLVFPVYFLIRFVILFWPFILYFWAGVWTVRQRTLLSLVQASVETKTPLAAMIRAYACDCFSPYFRARLENFALSLEQGHSLGEAIRQDRGLFRYDIVGMLRLGGDDPATLQAMENSAREERDYSPVRSMAIIRIAYFFSLVFPLISVVLFMMYAIVPKFEAIFHDFDTALPAMTVFAIAVSSFFMKYFYVFFPLVPLIAMFFFVFFIVQTNVVVWRPPFFRKMFRDTDSAKLLRLLAVGLKHRVSVPEILLVYRSIVPSFYLQLKVARVEQNILDGRDWIESLKKQRFVSGPEATLLETAQRTGNTATVLDQLAAGKENAQLRKDDLTSKLLFIPCLLGIALVIGIFAIAMFLPLVTLTCSLSG